MTENFKKYLGIVGLVGIILTSVAIWRFADAYSNAVPVTAARSFTTSGEGKVVAIPDVAEFSFSVITEGGKDLGSLQNQNTSKANKVIEFVKLQGVDAKDIKTSSYSVNPKYNNCYYPTAGSSCVQNIVGYSISQSVTVKLRNFDKIGDTISGVVNQGANSVYGPNFTMDDPSDLKNQARAKAVQAAQKQAQDLAKAGNFRLGKLLSIDESSYSPRPVYLNQSLGMGAADMKSVSAPSIEPGSQDISVSVTLRYEIK